MIETPTIIELGFVLLTSLLSSGVSYYLGKRKSGREDFDTLITVEELKEIISEKEKELEFLGTENTNVKNEILEKERKLSEFKIDVLKQQVKIVQLEDKIKTLEKR